jgi:N-acetylglucosamine kinase-like BadF-type ATPase
VTTAFLGIDIGGTGSRSRLVSADGVVLAEGHGPRGAVTAGGSAGPDLALALIERVLAEADAVEIVGIGIGATGIATLVADPDDLVHRARALVPRAAVAVSIDAVTGHLGALSGAAGAVIAVGTGAIALGADFRGVWNRVDGWGHLLGDRGSGSWIGERALQVAMRQRDGVSTDAGAILDAARERFGDPMTWPAQLYTRDDRAGVLASFAADIAGLDDPLAREIIREAATEAAQSAVAALPGLPPRISATGGLLRSEEYAATFGIVVRELRPDAELVVPAGGPLEGSVHLARLVASAPPAPAAGFLWA